MTKANSLLLILLTSASILVTVAWPIALGITSIEGWQRVADSTFFITIFSTLVAAFFGAYGAQFIVEKLKEKERVLQEIRNVNSAVATSIHIFNSIVILKRQHLKKSKIKYDEDRQKVLADESAIFEIFLDLQIMPKYDLPVKGLREKIQSSINLEIRGLILVEHLAETLTLLNEFITKRNDYIEKYKEKAVSEDRMALCKEYFGIRNPAKITDLSYPAIIEGLWLYNEDCIYYSYELYDSLYQHGRLLKKLIKDENITIVGFDFTHAKTQSLIPAKEMYVDWEKAFV